jgi:cellulose synthase/poly-beta-1,6-N-acetylglucosamine synthase-like glycosyltransferase
VVPLFLLLMFALTAWLLMREGPGEAPRDLSVVLRVQNGAEILEALLRAAQSAGVSRVRVIDEGSTDLTRDIVGAWARKHPGVEVRDHLDMADLPVTSLVLDAREPDGAWHAERVLRWLGNGSHRPTASALR